jgi:hypothetical protein
MMKRTMAFAVVAMFLIVGTVATAVASSKSNRINTHYVPPKNALHQQIYLQLQERRSLEKLKEFLSPFRLPRTLDISLAGCDGEADAFYEDAAITICYEYVNELWENRPEKTTPSGIAPVDTVIGPLVDTTLHEFAHALFDMLKLPVLGPEETAADLVAAYIYLQLRGDEGHRLISGTVYAYSKESKNRTAPLKLKEFADEHGTPEQRAYNLLCIAYGADAKLFGDFVSKGYLPERRAEFCYEEYEQIQDAFEQLITPHIDRALAEKIMNKNWLPDRNQPILRR